MDLTTATPLEIDTKLAQLHDELSDTDRRLAVVTKAAHSLNGEKPVRHGRKYLYERNVEETLNELALRLADGQFDFYTKECVADCINRHGELSRQYDAAQAQIQAIDIEYNGRPWSRFIAVEGGHIHSSRFCEGGTIRVTTKIGWHPELSGKTQAEAVELLGELLCTHCFPDAPVAWTTGVAKKKVAEGYCDGQGEQGINLQMKYVSPRGNCPKCKQATGISKTGKVLKHKLLPQD